MKPRLAFCSPGHLQSLAHINDPVSPHSSVWNESWSADFSGWTVPPSGAAILSRVQASPLQYGFHPALSNESLSTPAYYSSDSGSGIPTTEQLKINQILEIYTIPICFFSFFFFFFFGFAIHWLECWVLSQLIHSPLSLSSRGSLVLLGFLT